MESQRHRGRAVLPRGGAALGRRAARSSSSGSERAGSRCRSRADGIPVIGVDSSRGMLEVCAERARARRRALDLRLGDLREPPVDERVPLVICPFRSLLHLDTDDDRREALRAVRGMLAPDGHFVFDVFAPSRDDIEETNGRWLEREPEIYERAGLGRACADADAVGAQHGTPIDDAARVARRRTNGPRCSRTTGFAIDACYGWFDRRPYSGGEDTIWVTRVAG